MIFFLTCQASLEGIVESAKGERFFYEFSHLNTDCFQLFLDLVSEQFADSFIIMQVEQAGCHRAKRLRLPSNIILIFQPAHSPELNPTPELNPRQWGHSIAFSFPLPLFSHTTNSMTSAYP